MFKEKEIKIPIISTTNTIGLTSIQQIVDTTANEFFSSRDDTSRVEITRIVILPQGGIDESE